MKDVNGGDRKTREDEEEKGEKKKRKRREEDFEVIPKEEHSIKLPSKSHFKWQKLFENFFPLFEKKRHFQKRPHINRRCVDAEFSL